MTDGNISMEEDTELRDLVAQTLENNGVLAKVRAELRASLFLALEEQESVMNPEPLLNKTVKQYLANSEGRLLFSLVREFLEYFGLEYTISVYDPETYSGKEYNYAGRSKLCEELGISSSEPLLGEILKNGMNDAFNNSRKNEDNNSRVKTSHETSTHLSNSTFEVTVPKMLHKDSMSLSNDNDSSEKMESVSESTPKIPINVTITDKKKIDHQGFNNVLIDTSSCELQKNSLREKETNSENVPAAAGIDITGNNNVNLGKLPTCPKDNNAVSNNTTHETEINVLNETNSLNKTEPLIKFDESIVDHVQTNQNDETAKQNMINNTELQNANNVQYKKLASTESKMGKTVFFDEIIIDGKKEKVGIEHNSQSSLLGDLPPLANKNNSIYGDLPSLNAKKATMNDLKELMDIGLASDGIDNYEEDFVSSASGSANEQSPSKAPDKCDSSQKAQSKKDDRPQSVRSEDITEDIEGIDEILSSTSCLDDVTADKTISNITVGITADYIEEV